MQVFQESAALVFELNADALPAVWLDLAHGFAVGELGLDLRDHEAQLARERSEERGHAGLIGRTMGKRGRQQWRAEDWTVGKDSRLVDAWFCRLGLDGLGPVRFFDSLAAVDAHERQDILPLGGEAAFFRVDLHSQRDIFPVAKRVQTRAPG